MKLKTKIRVYLHVTTALGSKGTDIWHWELWQRGGPRSQPMMLAAGVGNYPTESQARSEGRAILDGVVATSKENGLAKGGRIRW